MELFEAGELTHGQSNFQGMRYPKVKNNSEIPAFFSFFFYEEKGLVRTVG